VTPDYYALLEVAPEAEHGIIRAAYLVLAKRYHPDAATAASPHNDGKFHLITEAYEILRDPELRAQYDSDHARQKLAQLEKFEDARRRAREQAQRKQRERAVRNLLVVVFAVGGFALGALAVGLVKVLAPDSFPANIDLAIHTEKFERSSNFLSDKAAQNQDQTELLQALREAEWLAARRNDQELLAQERARSRGLEQQLAARRDDQELLAQERTRSQGLEQQLAARRNDQELLAQERARSQGLEQQLAARRDDEELLAQERARSQGLEQQLAARRDDQELLAQERARSQGLEQQLVARQDATLGRGHHATASLPATPDPKQAAATHTPPTAPLPTNDKPVMPASDWPATTPARPTASEAPGNPEPADLMARASVLLSQGNIGVARIVLERAAEMGSARALFALAETYDPVLLSAWGTFGTQGDVGKAQELYAKAFAGGIREAKDRLNASRW
jgi:curved DNA-binding protein CbpA